MTTLAEYHAHLAKEMSERSLQDAVIALADRLGFMVYHTYDSRRSTAGYPDLHLVHPGRGVHLMRELKKQSGRVTAAQQDWLTALAAAGVDVGVWRPLDFYDKTIERTLRGERP